MDSSDEKVLLESCCLLLDYHQEQIKKKGKRRWCQKYFKKEQNKEFTIIYCRRCVSMIENRISGYLYNELFSESNEEKCTAFQRMVCSLIVHKNTIKNWSTAFQVFSFWSLFLYPQFPFSQRQEYFCSSSAKLSACCICFPHFFSFSLIITQKLERLLFSLQ